MRILVISDLHGDLRAAWEALDRFQPDVLLSCGDWGDPDELSEAELAAFPARLPVYTTFGNHDAMDALAALRNGDGSRVLLAQGEAQNAGDIRLAAIGGIWAKSHRPGPGPRRRDRANLRGLENAAPPPHYVTDEDVAAAAERIARGGPVDLLLTHGCPAGMADRTTRGNNGGQRCFLEAFETVKPRVHLCGHLHVAQERALDDGRKVLNVGATPHGSVVIVEVEGEGISARLERFSREAGVQVLRRSGVPSDARAS